MTCVLCILAGFYGQRLLVEPCTDTNRELAADLRRIGPHHPPTAAQEARQRLYEQYSARQQLDEGDS